MTVSIENYFRVSRQVSLLVVHLQWQWGNRKCDSTTRYVYLRTFRMDRNVATHVPCLHSRSRNVSAWVARCKMGNEVNFRTNRGIERRNSSSATGFFFFLIRLRFPRLRGPKPRFSVTRYRKAMGFKMYEPHRTKRYFIQKPERRQEHVTRY